MNRFVVASLALSALTGINALEGEGFSDLRFQLQYLPGIDSLESDFNSAYATDIDAKASFGLAVQYVGCHWMSDRWGIVAGIQGSLNRHNGVYHGTDGDENNRYTGYAIGLLIGPSLRVTDRSHLEFTVTGDVGIGKNDDFQLALEPGPEGTPLSDFASKSYSLYHQYGLKASYIYAFENDVVLGGTLGLIQGFGRTEYRMQYLDTNDPLDEDDDTELGYRYALRDKFAGFVLGFTIGSRF